MSGPSTPGAKPEKTMSSRLLTMKFMQRAAAAQAAQQSPSTDDNPAPKRPRLSTDGPGSTSPATARSSDLEAISAAVAAEEQKRAEAVARQAAEAGETEWVLNIPGAAEGTGGYAQQPYIVPAGSLDAEDEDMAYGGRRSYGNFKRKKAQKTTDEDDTSDSDSEDEDEEDLDENDMSDPSQIDAMIRRAKAQAAKKNKKEKKKEPQVKPVNLSRLTSISGGGGLISHSGGKKHGGGKGQKRKKR
ncbi:hypothetical protein VTN00DRAFT_6580 [Thermoascus crustaceus]|uniref:uncharacterized protein n=1 Tax=Thermoascus crustaceus TaxID=5088 RepID=UPI0037449755